MIFGRPTNLWLGLATAVVGAITVSLVAFGFDPVVVATISGAWGSVVGALILLVANAGPTLAPGDTYTIQTPKGQPNYIATVAPPPASTKPTPDLEPK